MDGDLRAMLAVMSRENRDEARRIHREVVSIVSSMGTHGRKFRRETTRRTRAIVSEIYSAPRVTDAARRHARFGAMPGLALDLTGHDDDGRPWDFNVPGKREKAERLLDAQRPVLLIGTPMCTAFSNIQNLNKHRRDPGVIAAEIEKARNHLKWCCHLYRKQANRGAYFLHEHPAQATSWKMPEIAEVLAIPGVDKVIADQCQLGQQTDQGDPPKKPTGFMSNAPEIIRELNRRCHGRRGLCSRPRGGTHAECLGKTAQRAAIFQEELLADTPRIQGPDDEKRPHEEWRDRGRH